MTEFSCCKLEIFIPESHLPVLQQALREADAGHIGSYDSCLSYSPVTSCWRPLTGSEPYLGQVGALSTEPELKVEVTCRREKLDETPVSYTHLDVYKRQGAYQGRAGCLLLPLRRPAGYL